MKHKVIRRTLVMTVLMLLLILGVRSFVSLGWIVPLVVHGNSMAPHYAEEAITASRLQAPRRWDPILFRDPHSSGQLWIKRIVGLPGEVVQLDKGDVWINGHRLHKDLVDQSRMRIQVAKSEEQSKWVADPGWKYKSGVWSCNSTDNQSLRLAEPVTDDLTCNSKISRRLNYVHDLMLSIKLKRITEGVLIFEMPHFQAKLSKGAISAYTHGGDCLFNRSLDGEEVQLTLSSFDHSALIAINGEVVFHQPLKPVYHAKSLGNLPGIFSNGTSACLRELSLWRDVYYTGPLDDATRPTVPTKVEVGGYYVLGDNPAVSVDSRNWDASASLPSSACLGVVASQKK